MTSKRTVFCDPRKYRAIHLVFDPHNKSRYNWNIDANLALYTTKDLLTVKPLANNHFLCSDAITGSTKEISIHAYGQICIQGWNSGPNAYPLKLTVEDFGKTYVVDFQSRQLNSRQLVIKKNSGLMPRRIGMRAPVVKRQTTWKQDPLAVKKSKYRHNIKAFWSKQGDAARSSGSFVSRYSPLQDLNADTKWSRGFMTKHNTFKYLAWKLGLTGNEVKTQLKNSQMTQGDSVSSFANWLVRRLVYIVVQAGFCTNYTDASKLITKGWVAINGQVVLNEHTQVAEGDLITFNPQVRDRLAHSTSQSSLTRGGSHCLVDYITRSIVVHNSLHVNVSIMSNLLDTSLQRSPKVMGSLSDPVVGILLRLIPFVSR